MPRPIDPTAFRPRHFAQLLRDAFHDWREDNASRLAAAPS